MIYKMGYIKYIRGIFMGSGLFILILLCSKLSDFDKDISLIISALLILLIIDNSINKKYEINCKNIFIICILGVSCQLFMENITIYILVFSLALVILSSLKYKNILKLSIPLLISNLIGMLIMFSNKGYKQVNADGYRSINVNNLSLLI